MPTKESIKFSEPEIIYFPYVLLYLRGNNKLFQFSDNDKINWILSDSVEFLSFSFLFNLNNQ